MQTVGFVGAVVLGFVLLASGLGKLRDRSGFVLAVLAYEVLPRRLAVLYARALPFVEVACGLVLLAGVEPAVAGAIAAALLVSFLVGVGVNLVRGRDLDCHCFGAGESEPLGWTTLARSSPLAGVAIMGAYGLGRVLPVAVVGLAPGHTAAGPLGYGYLAHHWVVRRINTVALIFTGACVVVASLLV